MDCNQQQQTTSQLNCSVPVIRVVRFIGGVYWTELRRRGDDAI